MKILKPTKSITRDDGRPYLFRTTLFECRFFAIKLHKLVSRDDECMHDHPWSFITLILKGGYIEETPVTNAYTGWRFGDKGQNFYCPTKKKIIHPFTIHYRPASWVHRLDIHQTCYTLVLSFKKVKDWGFFTKLGYISWRKYNHKQHCE